MRARHTFAAMMAVAVTSVVGVSSASANGPCGVDYNGPTACGVTAPAAINGTILQNYENDYYVFWAPAGTQVATTITDEISPSCANTGHGCGEVFTYLADSGGDELYPSESSHSYYNNGVLLVGHGVATLTHTGTYYLILAGSPASDGNGSVPTPYALSVTANSGAIQWPAPTPVAILPKVTPVIPTVPPPVVHCVVPRWGGQFLGTVRHRLAVNHCSVGQVRFKRAKYFPRGMVLKLDSVKQRIIFRPGTSLPAGSRIDVLVSKGRH